LKAVPDEADTGKEKDEDNNFRHEILQD
jgi:hypothetical protein